MQEQINNLSSKQLLSICFEQTKQTYLQISVDTCKHFVERLCWLVQKYPLKGGMVHSYGVVYVARFKRVTPFQP